MAYYSMAWNAARMPASLIAKAVNSVVLVTFARFQDDRARVRRGVDECLGMSYVLLTPACAGLWLLAPQLVTIVLGPRWLPVVPALRIMCVTVLAELLIYVYNAALISFGRGHLLLIPTAARVATLLVTVPVFARRWGVGGAAWADMLATALATVALLLVSRGVIGGRGAGVLRATWRPLTAAVFATVGAWACGGWLPDNIAGTAGRGLFLCGLYAGVLWLVGGGERMVRAVSIPLALIRPSGQRG